MEIAKVSVSGVAARTIWAEPIPAGIRGATVKIEYTDPMWDGLVKNVAFTGVVDTPPILDVGDEVYLPEAVVSAPNALIKMSITGLAPDGAERIPTLWADLGTTWPAAPTDLENGVEEETPVPTPMEQLEVKIHNNEAEIARSGSELYKDPITGKLYLMRDEKKLDEGIPLVDGLPFDGGYVDAQGYLHLTMGGEDVEGFKPFYVGTGTGGGGGSTYTITITNLLESRVITVAENERVVLRFNYSSVDSEGMDDGSGLGQLLIGGVVRHSFSAKQGENELDITEYLASGTNNVSIRITNSEDANKSMAYTVTVAAVSLTSPFDASQPITGPASFPYIPTGIAEKTMHFELDGVEIGTASVTTSGRQQSFTIPAQSHGSHVWRVWFTCTISGVEISSNVLYYNLICLEEGNTTPVIAVTTPPLSGVEQFTNIVKKWRVHSPNSLTSPVTLEVNDEIVSSQTVDRTEQTWTYRPETVGQITQTIRCGDVSVSQTHNVTESSIKVEAETEALALNLSSYGRSNNETNPGVWESNGISAEFSGFNFVSDGWVQDEEDITVLRVTGDARLNIPYRMFANDFRTTGKTLEFDFTTRNVLNDDAEILSCWSGGRGFRLTARQIQLVSEQSTMFTPYKAKEDIHVMFVVQKRSEHRLILCYVNGIMSGAVQYPEDDDFSQADPVDITVGSNECTLDLRTIRAYDNSLTPHQAVNNWVCAAQNIPDRLARFKRNDVYDEYGKVVIEKLPGNLCYMVIRCEELPKFKGDKKKCSGYFVDLLHPERSFSFTDAEIDVQGTSSQYYVVKNLKGKFKVGFIMPDGTVVLEYAMDENTIPTSIFTLKADVASSEGAYNTVSAKLYNDLHPFKTPAMEADPRVRHSINGFPMVIFHESSAGLKFIGKYNFNLDKGTPEPFGLTEGDERWEVLQNGTARVGFHSADFSDDSWKEDYEANYPEDNTNTTNLQAMSAWVNSCDTEQATGAEIEAVPLDGTEYTADTAEYRLAKFKAELADWFVPQATDWYYLFTELLLCMDQREKNVLWRFIFALLRWIADYYDGDSIIGHNNQAQPVFEYWMEDIDYTESGDPVYNGQNSVFWQNVRKTRHDAIKKLYQEMRTDGRLSYEVVYGAIEAHQAYWPEAIFNEDMQIKCLDALEKDGDTTYLSFLRGKKELWTKDFLYKRFRYMDSKYETGDSMKCRLTIRTNKMANLTLTFCMKLCAHTYYNAECVENRVEKDVPCEFVSKATGAEDRVIGVNDADKLKNMGDLAPHYVELIDLTPCEMLEEIKLGDGAEDYVNYSLTSVTFGNNILLRRADIRNCPNLVMAPDVSGCTNIEEFLAEGSGITGIKLPNGGVLKTLHLPGTVVSLQIINQPQLADFSIPGYNQITTLRLENAGVAESYALEILNQIAANSRIRVLDVNWTMDNADSITRLLAMRGLDENGNTVDKPVLTGKAYCAVITQAEIDTITAAFPDLALSYGEIVTSYTVTFKNWDGTVFEEATQTVRAGSAARNPVTAGMIDRPTKAPTLEEAYTYTGWDTPLTNITADTVVTAVYNTSVRQYAVRYWYDEAQTQLLQETYVPVYGSCNWEGGELSRDDGALWLGWDGLARNVQSDLDLHALFAVPVLPDYVPAEYDYLYSDDPADKSAYTAEEFYGILYYGRERDYFALGDKIKMVCDTPNFTDTEIVFALRSYKHFMSAEREGEWAGPYFGMIGLMNEGLAMNSSRTNAGGYPATNAAVHLNDVIYPGLSQFFRKQIERIVVLSSAGGQSYDIVSLGTYLTHESIAELGHGATVEPYVSEVAPGADEVVFSCYTDDASRAKKKANNTGTAASYSLRSPVVTASHLFFGVYDPGSIDYSYTNGNSARALSYGFCLRSNMAQREG